MVLQHVQQGKIWLNNWMTSIFSRLRRRHFWKLKSLISYATAALFTLKSITQTITDYIFFYFLMISFVKIEISIACSFLCFFCCLETLVSTHKRPLKIHVTLQLSMEMKVQNKQHVVATFHAKWNDPRITFSTSGWFLYQK